MIFSKLKTIERKILYVPMRNNQIGVWAVNILRMQELSFLLNTKFIQLISMDNNFLRAERKCISGLSFTKSSSNGQVNF